MVKDINGLVSQPKIDQRSTGNSQKAGKTENSSATSSESTSPKAAADQVELSTNAQILKSAEAKLESVPEVNEARVAEIKAALANNEIKVDALSVADKMLALDALL